MNPHGEVAGGAPEQGVPPAAVGRRAQAAAAGQSSDELAELLNRSARGDREAFASLYDATSARIFGLMMRVVRDRSQAEEVTQEVFMEIWRSASRFDPERGSALAWMMTIGHRKAVDRVRSVEASARRDTSFTYQNHTITHDETVETAMATLEARRVRVAMEQLTDVQREAIELAYFGGYSHSEVAALLDIPVGTAKTRIRDGLIRLRDAIGVGR